MNKHITFSEKKQITFTDDTLSRIELFSIYSDLDKEIITEASKNNLYLIGGTAIEIWLNHLGIKGWRKRSDNDLDFLINKVTSNQLESFNEFLEHKGFEKKSNLSYKFNKIEIDFLEVLDENKDLLELGMFKVINSIKLMSPVFLFTSKFNRISYLFCKNRNKYEADIYERDLKDLVDLLKIIKKLNLNKEFNKYLKLFFDYNEVDNIKMIEEFINKELDKL